MAKVIAIVGPTGVGKTKLSLSVAHQFHGEVISGDSQQVYRHLNIGTAKLMPADREGIPHYLIDVRDVNQRFSAADFQTSAAHLIPAIAKRGHLPMIVGGTGFYLRALMEGMQLGDHYDARTRAIRKHLAAELATNGADQLWHRLAAKDPDAAAAIPVGNGRRIVRALEVIEATGHLFSTQRRRSSDSIVGAAANNDYLLIGLTTDRYQLYQRINHRVELMMKAGLLNEARWLYKQGGEHLPAGRAIGYREFFPYFENKATLPQAVDRVKVDSRHYAKRQLTWFHNQATCHWFDLVSGHDHLGDVNQLIDQFLKK